MFNKVIPLEMLVHLPLPFVHRLRDLRIQQLQEANKQQEQMIREQQAAGKKQPPNRFTHPAMMNGSFADLIDELTL